jgi:hypothetical protein
MKSIVEEASSIAKAVEKAWYSAQKPQEFTVKVLEEAQRNFIGLTTRSAKVAIYFQDKPQKQPKKNHQQKPAQKKTQPQPKPQKKEVLHKATHPQQGQKAESKLREKAPRHKSQHDTNVTEKKPKTAQPREPQQEKAPERQAPQKTEPKPRDVWTPEMVNDAQKWLSKAVQDVTQKNIDFTTDVEQFHLKIKFQEPILKEVNKQKQLFASLATLVIQMLKHKHKQSLKGHKVVITAKSTQKK